MGNVIKKRRKKMRKHKYKKLRAKMRHRATPGHAVGDPFFRVLG
jgi:hypothetical protein